MSQPFTHQIRSARRKALLWVAVFAVMFVLSLVVLVSGAASAGTFVTAGVSAAGLALEIVRKRTMRRYEGIADLCDSLRAIAADAPADPGMMRLYTDTVHGHELIVLRGDDGAFGEDSFTLTETRDTQENPTNFLAREIIIPRRFPVVRQQTVSADEPQRSMSAKLRAGLLSNRLGLLVPTRAEIETVLRTVEVSDHRDLPIQRSH